MCERSGASARYFLSGSTPNVPGEDPRYATCTDGHKKAVYHIVCVCVCVSMHANVHAHALTHTHTIGKLKEQKNVLDKKIDM